MAGVRVQVPPRQAMLEHGVEDDEQLAHAGREGHLLRLTSGHEPPVEDLDNRIEPAGYQRRHVQCGSDPTASSPDGASAMQRAAVSVEGRRTDQGGDLPPVQGAQFGQVREKGEGELLPHAGHRAQKAAAPKRRPAPTATVPPRPRPPSRSAFFSTMPSDSVSTSERVSLRQENRGRTRPLFSSRQSQCGVTAVVTASRVLRPPPRLPGPERSGRLPRLVSRPHLPERPGPVSASARSAPARPAGPVSALARTAPARPAGPVSASARTAPARPAGPVSASRTAPARPAGPVSASARTAPARPAGPVSASARTAPARPAGPVSASARTAPARPAGPVSASARTDCRRGRRDRCRRRPGRTAAAGRRDRCRRRPGRTAAGRRLVVRRRAVPRPFAGEQGRDVARVVPDVDGNATVERGVRIALRVVALQRHRLVLPDRTGQRQDDPAARHRHRVHVHAPAGLLVGGQRVDAEGSRERHRVRVEELVVDQRHRRPLHPQALQPGLRRVAGEVAHSAPECRRPRGWGWPCPGSGSRRAGRSSA